MCNDFGNHGRQTKAQRLVVFALVHGRAHLYAHIVHMPFWPKLPRLASGGCGPARAGKIVHTCSLKQGCSVSPMIFRRTREDVHGEMIPFWESLGLGVVLDGTRIFVIRWADDTWVLATGADDDTLHPAHRPAEGKLGNAPSQVYVDPNITTSDRAPTYLRNHRRRMPNFKEKRSGAVANACAYWAHVQLDGHRDAEFRDGVRNAWTVFHTQRRCGGHGAARSQSERFIWPYPLLSWATGTRHKMT